MECKVFWLDQPDCPRLGLMPWPRGGDWLEDEIASLKRQGTDVLVSLLTDKEVEELDLRQEGELCAEHGIEVVSFPIEDRAVPPHYNEFCKFQDLLLERLMAGKRVAIHCFAGIGRSGLVAACLLIAHDVPPSRAISMVSSARGLSIPDTDEQEKWIYDFAERNRKDSEP